MLEGLCTSLVLLESLCTDLVLLASLESCTPHTLPLVHGDWWPKPDTLLRS